MVPYPRAISIAEAELSTRRVGVWTVGAHLQKSVLWAIWVVDGERVSLSQLCTISGCALASTSRSIRALVDAGLVERLEFRGRGGSIYRVRWDAVDATRVRLSPFCGRGQVRKKSISRAHRRHARKQERQVF